MEINICLYLRREHLCTEFRLESLLIAHPRFEMCMLKILRAHNELSNLLCTEKQN